MKNLYEESHKEIINWLNSLVSINSVYPNEKEICEFIKTKFENLGYVVKTQNISKDRYNIVVTKKEFKHISNIALYSHLDTVVNVDGWTKNPFKLTLENNKAYGLGTYDMKGGMVANILTFLDKKLADTQMHLIFCVDEENISEGAYKLIESNLIKDIKCIVSTEPAFKYDQNGITIGRVGHPIFLLNLKRPSTHFMFYDPTIDLNLLASKFIKKLKKFYINKKDKRQFIYVNKYCTINHGMSVPESVEIELEIALLPPLDSDKLLNDLKEIIFKESKKFSKDITIDLKFKDRKTPFLNPYEIDKNNYFLKRLSKAVQIATKNKAKHYFRSSVGDDNVFANAGFTVLGIGPSGGNAHAPDEWVSIPSINTLKEILVQFVCQSINL